MNRASKWEDPEESIYGGNSKSEQNACFFLKINNSVSAQVLLVLLKSLVINYWVCKAVILFESRFQVPSAQYSLLCIEENFACFSGTTAEYHYIITHK